MSNITRVVAVSGGKDSTAMALRLAEVEPDDYTYICTPTGDEPEAFFAHMRTLGGILGKPIVPLMHYLGLNGLIAKQSALPNFRQRWCTRMLKIEPFMEWLRLNAPAISYVGLRADEPTREGGFYEHIPGITQRYPLREWGWNESDVLTYLEERHITIPFRLDCQRCFFQTLYEWHLLWTESPEVYAEAEAQEAATGHTFRSPQRDTQPTGLTELREKFESGYAPKPKGSALRRLQCRVCTL
jgi:3'-phosphoadenosine 5'-phosphosulfate sulfotransferase (PAPS reductase)/FAD synthetase